MGFGALRVINDDVISAGEGFGMHSHRDMEIITIPTKGRVAHKDSIGNEGTVPAGDVQVMSAGTGVTHSEYNASSTDPLCLFQIWIEPKESGVSPRYLQKSFDLANLESSSTLLVGPIGTGLPLTIHQDAYISYVVLSMDAPLTYTLKEKGNGVYFFVIEGEVALDGEVLRARDAIGVSDTAEILISSLAITKALIIEVPLG